MTDQTPTAQFHRGPATPDPAVARGSVERVEGEHDIQPFRRWVTWRTYFDGVFLGNAVDEAEGWRWIADMVKLEARDGRL